MATADPRYAEVLQALAATFPRGSLTRGMEYATKQRVSDLQSFDGDRKIVAHVRGSGGNVYRCTILLKRAADGIYFEARCNCSVQFDCKHAAAAALETFAGRSLAAVLDAGPEQQPARQTRPQVEEWARRMAGASAAAASEPQAEQELRWIAKAKDGYGGIPTLEAAFVTRNIRGEIGRVRAVSITTISTSRAASVSFVDRSVARMLEEFNYTYTLGPEQIAPFVDDLVRRLVTAGKLFYDDATSEPLALGDSRPGNFVWQRDDAGRQRLQLEVVGEPVIVLPWLRPWYVDTKKSLIGSINNDLSLEELRLALGAPVLDESEIMRVDSVLREQKSAPRIPLPSAFVREQIHELDPLPRLAVYRDEHEKTVAGLSFSYDQERIMPGSPGTQIRKRSGDVSHVYRRNLLDEQAFLARLTSTQLGSDTKQAYGELVFPIATEHLATFLFRDLDSLRNEGWEIDMHPSVGTELIDATTVSLKAQLHEQTNRLFACDLGVLINGERIALTPILMKLFRECGDTNLTQYLAEKADNNRLFATLPDGRFIALPLERVQRMANFLVEMLNQKREGDVLVSLPAAVALHEAGNAGVELDDTALSSLALALRERSFGAHIAVPTSLRAQLRPYQYDGLRWLQFLRESCIGGILADDMGLGKTLQTLAHILVEKEAGRVVSPVLVVAPTSVVPNWLAEAERFAPTLGVLAYHGPSRHEHDARLHLHDVVVTSYPLLLRDQVLIEQSWYMVVLDEAQTIKNPQAKIARAVRSLQAEQRIALSGTPVENHLGELWSLFEFLMPGAFGDLSSFHRIFRFPIEKNGDQTRKQILIDRVRPFILRRTKEVVAADLPPKTEIVQRIDLHPEQLDLYETVRVAMDHKVRKQMKEHGLAQSRIIVLDALLKLRQVCCDARLVKLPSARTIRHNAKLTTLLTMVQEMLEEGRHLIIFSPIYQYACVD